MAAAMHSVSQQNGATSWEWRGEHNPLDQFDKRTEVVYEHRRAFDERKHRVLLQLHILWNLSRAIVLRAQC
jgi:hypothetical protein